MLIVKLIKYFRGYVRVKVEGYAPERLLNLCNANGLLIWDVENKGQFYKLCIGVKDYHKLRPFARKTGTKITLLEKRGFPFFMNRFRKRTMFFGGMLLCFLLIFALSFFVWNIHIEGNVTQSNEEILEKLETMGITHGTKKSEIVCEAVETGLRKEYPNILWVSAELKGTRMILLIKENEDKDIVSRIEEKDRSPVSIVSDISGVVESMIVRQGTPLVKVGEEVSKDQILVDGYYEIKNDAGETVRYEGVAADGEIVIRCVENYQDQFSKEYEIKNYTKRKRYGIKIKVFHKTFDLQPKISFENYDVVQSEKTISITENFVLPFSVAIVTYQEYVPEKKDYTQEEVKRLAAERYFNKYKNILQKGVQIIEKDVKIDINGKLCIVGGYATLRVPITTKVPAIIPDISVENSGEGEH